jgi:hypothetical protein
MRTRNTPRAGMLLILVVAFAAILVSITVVYLGRMRSDASEATGILNEAQARIMLYAAMNYIQETARIGWHPVGQGGRMIET